MNYSYLVALTAFALIIGPILIVSAIRENKRRKAKP